MLGDKDVAATIAVKDIAAASDFYENTLGLQRVEMEGMGDEAGAVIFRSGSSGLCLSTNQPTLARTRRRPRRGRGEMTSMRSWTG
jgi:catechol 2,3-dioxygenase-like lactoylglutathione lyase family enzyme